MAQLVLGLRENSLPFWSVVDNHTENVLHSAMFARNNLIGLLFGSVSFRLPSINLQVKQVFEVFPNFVCVKKIFEIPRRMRMPLTENEYRFSAS